MVKQKRSSKKTKKRKFEKPKLGKPPKHDPDAYLILRTGMRAMLKDKRVLEDVTPPDVTIYIDNREKTYPGKTIKNEFKKNPWKPSSLNTVKG